MNCMSSGNIVMIGDIGHEGSLSLGKIGSYLWNFLDILFIDF